MDENEIEGARTQNLIGEADVTAACIPCLWSHAIRLELPGYLDSQARETADMSGNTLRLILRIDHGRADCLVELHL
jgi:hypothetical protein